MSAPPSPFLPAALADVGDFVRDQMLGLIISDGPPACVTPLPLLVTVKPDGAPQEFFGHFGRSNPQIEALRNNGRALVVFMGPHAYISPTWISQPKWAPTWNYALAYFEVEVRFTPEENDRSLSELATALEGDRWSLDRLEERYALLAPQILAFRARVIRQIAKFKLGQDESDGSFTEILDHMGPTPLAKMMRQARRTPDGGD